MREVLTSLVGVLAVWRVTYMIVNEDGPLAIFARLRAWTAKRLEKPGSLDNALNCFLCLSVWMSMPIAYLLSYDVLSFIIFTLAISTLAIILNYIIERLEQR